MQLCCIIDHLEDWFIQVYRPWVSGCLDQWRYQRIRKDQRIARLIEIDRRRQTGESPFKDHRLRWLEPADSESEVTEANSEDDGGDYDDDIGSVAWLEEIEPRDERVSSKDEDTGSDDNTYEERDIKIKVEEIESLDNEALEHSYFSDDSRPVSARTRRSKSAVPLSRKSTESLLGVEESAKSPGRSSGTYTRPAAHHIDTSPLDYKMPLRNKKNRCTSEID